VLVVSDSFGRNDAWCAEFDSADDSCRVVVPVAPTFDAGGDDSRAAALAAV